jgi:hypothetical protein
MNSLRSLAKISSLWNLVCHWFNITISIGQEPIKKSKTLKCHEKNSSAGPKNRPAQLSQGWLSELRQIALSDHFRISIFWVAWLAYASDSNRCNIPAWSHRAWREPDMSFRTLRRSHRAFLWGLCCKKSCHHSYFRFRIFPFISLTFGIDSKNRSLLQTSHQTQLKRRLCSLL